MAERTPGPIVARFQVWKHWLASAGLVLALLAGLTSYGLLDRWEWLVGDAFKRLDASRQSPLPDIKFILFDQKSLDAGEAEFGLTWPWPRETYTKILSFLDRTRVRGVVLDFVFSEPSFSGVADDQQLARALRRSGRTYLPVFARLNGGWQSIQSLYAAQPRSLKDMRIEAPLRWKLHTGVNLPVPLLLNAVAGVGEARFSPDPDGVMRRFQPFVPLTQKFLPAFGLAAWLEKKDTGPLRLLPGEVRFGDQKLWLDENDQVEMRFPGTWGSYQPACLSAIDIITSETALEEGAAPRLKPETFAGSMVFIGSTAEALLDLRATPLEWRVPGIYLNACVYAAAAKGWFYDARWRDRFLWPLLLVLALLGAGWGARPITVSWLGTAATLFVLLAATVALFWWGGVVLDVVAPVIALTGSWGVSSLLTFTREQRQKHFIQSAFHQMLSPDVVSQLLRHPGRLKAGGDVADVTVYFSDLQGFTTLAEKLDPQSLVRVLNLYLKEMIEGIVDEQHGYVDKFIGDAVMAFWGAPLPDEDHAYHACLAAVRNQDRLAGLQERLRAEGLEAPLIMRIGIHTGQAVVGMMGSPTKLNYTAIGDAVNLASRLEGINKRYGTRIIISGETRARLGERMVVRELDRVRVKGKETVTKLYELVGSPERLSQEQWMAQKAYDEGLRQYYQREFSAAIAHFHHVLRAAPNDEPSKAMIARCEGLLVTPPPQEWDGVTVFESK